ncbi:MAG TPA: phosphate signaling complex protein PhoU [Candidatus Acidoferrales bacterium]|jgi:phosphate transport system protein|nr:phosphate signaling complex protein PhoU [Candidatus Acidoferrales bacterium]
MESHNEISLELLKQKLLTMASYAETAVNEALQALQQRDVELAKRVKEKDRAIDQFEVEIDDLVIQLLTKAPLASNLRLVTITMKISQDLERVGDEATKIAKRARDLAQEPPLKIVLDLPRMAALALDMLKAALDAFVNRDSTAARAVIPRDKEVDAINKQIHNMLAQRMVEDTSTISRCLHLMVVSKSLERIADHATNVAEDVVYLCEAQDIRHTGMKSQMVGA